MSNPDNPVDTSDSTPPPSAPATRNNRRFDGPFHASQLVDFSSGCGYAWKLREVEGVPEAFRHAKAMIGDVVHTLLELWHTEDLGDVELRAHGHPEGAFGFWLEELMELWQEYAEKGNPRYPDRAHLPLFYGRERDGDGSRPIEPEEFTDKWLPVAAQWLTEYTACHFNQNFPNLATTLLVETSFRLMLRGDKKSDPVYPLHGRIDYVRKHYSMATVPRSLLQQERLRPGTIQDLEQRLADKGYLIELGDWKSGKSKPVFPRQRDPWVMMTKAFQPRIYALALLEGEVGELTRSLGADGLPVESFVTAGEVSVVSDFYTWYHLPGHERRQKGERQPQHKGKRFKEGQEPADLYEPGKAPGDPKEADPRISILIRPQDYEATRKDARRVIAAIRLNQFFRAPGQMTCTSCRFTRECEQDLDIPIIDDKMMRGFDFDEFADDDYGLEAE